MQTLPQCVERGITFLDNKRPGWQQRIDLSTLDMGNGCFSLIAQVEGLNYREALIRLGLHTGETRDRNGRPVYPDLAGVPYAFMRHITDPPQEGIERWTADELQVAWVDWIRQLKRERRAV